MGIDRFTSAGPIDRGRENVGRWHNFAAGGGSAVDTVARAAAATAQTSVEAITPQANEIIPAGASVFGPWGELKNETAGAITLGSTNPPTEGSLLADGLTAPSASGGFEQITLATNVAITPNPNPQILKSIELTAATPVVVFETRNVVEYPINNPTAVGQRIDLQRNTVQDIRLVGSFDNYVDPILNVNYRKVSLIAESDLSGWILISGGTN